jgi:hypothetical protein
MFGLVDEASKLNINVGFPNNQQTEQRLLGLPGFTQNQSYDIADSIISWRDANGTPYGQGAGPAYYAAMDPPYFTKLAGFETVEELLQVQGFEGEAGRQILFGDGTAPPLGSATSQSGMSLATNGMGNDPDVSRGLYDLLTVNSTMSDGGNGSLNGPINLSTAPPQVLACLQYQGGPIPPDILQQLISERSAAAAYGDPTNTNWVTLAGVMTPNSDFTQLNPASTPPLPQTVFRPSYRYSADILAVSANGRAFKRVKVIFDTQATDAGTPTNQYTGATLPIQIVYRRDFTEHGWPMDPQVLEDIRAGKLKQQAR